MELLDPLPVVLVKVIMEYYQIALMAGFGLYVCEVQAGIYRLGIQLKAIEMERTAIDLEKDLPAVDLEGFTEEVPEAFISCFCRLRRRIGRDESKLRAVQPVTAVAVSRIFVCLSRKQLKYAVTEMISVDFVDLGELAYSYDEYEPGDLSLYLQPVSGGLQSACGLSSGSRPCPHG